MPDYSALTSVVADTITDVLPAIAGIALAIVIVHAAEWGYHTVMSMLSNDSFDYVQDENGNWHYTGDDK